MKQLHAQFMLLTLVMLLGSATVATGNDGLLNPNTASAEEMAALPHMDAELAAVVVANRKYATIGDLDELLSADLDDDQLEELYGRLFVPIDLNNASRSDILLIPGVGSRMAHEFDEYRPYADIEQFRREIGKYVDEAEVARLEQYVTLN